MERITREDGNKSGKTVKEILESTTCEVCSTFAVRDKSAINTYRSGSAYGFSLVLSDKTGDITLKYWGGEDKESVKRTYSGFELGDVVRVKGYAKPYKGKVEISVNPPSHSIERVGESDPSLFLRVGPRNIQELLSDLDRLIQSVAEPNLANLLNSVFSDSVIRQKLEILPGSTTNHHMYLGGLLDHIVGVAKICESICSRYPQIDRDFLITAALLHDIGKFQEYKIKGAAFVYSLEGIVPYVDHIWLCEHELSQWIKKIEGFPESYANEIRHMVLSHHGSADKGSVVQPKFIEAEVLHLADYTDSQIAKFLEATEDFSDDQKGAINQKLERRIIRGAK